MSSIKTVKRQLTVLLTILTVLLSLVLIGALPATAADTVEGANIFKVHCAGCHAQGGNIIRRGKNLKQKALKRYGMDSRAAIANLVTNGKNNMSAYQDRLSPDEIDAVSAYVLEQAANGWRR
ncbi:MAG: c-type cytochrome [Cyanothece sp. SIO1E1]|nr:c-type cytochrome [Cyanothece sp. SIO1E1]